MPTLNFTTADEVLSALQAIGNSTQRDILMKFFKTGKGEYGEGDIFLGIRVPQTRSVAKNATTLSDAEIEELLVSPFHEARLCGFLIMVDRMQKLASPKNIHAEDCIRKREQLVRFYLKNARHANNWDLVDFSAPKILGEWLTTPSDTDEGGKLATLDRLSESQCLWEQRIAMVATHAAIRKGDFRYTLRYAERLLGHKHDLMHKAVGWMLREMGKRDINTLRAFLDRHYSKMSRTTLRYAIERMDAKERKSWLERK